MLSNRRLYQLDHCTYICQYHIVWTTKYRGKVMADNYIKQELKRIFKAICRWKDFRLISWHIGDEHIHLYLIIPPKFSIAYAIQILKGKSSNWIKKKTKKFPQGSLWGRGYYACMMKTTSIAGGFHLRQITGFLRLQVKRKKNLLFDPIKFSILFLDSRVLDGLCPV